VTISLDSIIRTLAEIEAEHPDTADRLEPIIQLLSGAAPATLTAEEAARLLGSSVTSVVYQVEHGLLPGTFDPTTGAWRLPFVDLVRHRAWFEALAALPGEDLDEDELARLAAAQPGSLPWQRAAS
jgi:hypothetical protein